MRPSSTRSDLVQIPKASAAALGSVLEIHGAKKYIFPGKPVLISKSPGCGGSTRITEVVYAFDGKERKEVLDFDQTVYLPSESHSLHLDRSLVTLTVGSVYETLEQLFAGQDAETILILSAAMRVPITTEQGMELLAALTSFQKRNWKVPLFEIAPAHVDLIFDPSQCVTSNVFYAPSRFAFLPIEGREPEAVDELLSNARKLASLITAPESERPRLIEALCLLATPGSKDIHIFK
ncbi:hypothetical protein HZC07_00480 [Candidatus Micrarchaeota archaeon]|nr:hypothetical protein [Candidatus Micrarchaeota archaeon]